MDVVLGESRQHPGFTTSEQTSAPGAEQSAHGGHVVVVLESTSNLPTSDTHSSTSLAPVASVLGKSTGHAMHDDVPDEGW